MKQMKLREQTYRYGVTDTLAQWAKIAEEKRAFFEIEDWIARRNEIFKS